MKHAARALRAEQAEREQDGGEHDEQQGRERKGELSRQRVQPVRRCMWLQQCTRAVKGWQRLRQRTRNSRKSQRLVCPFHATASQSEQNASPIPACSSGHAPGSAPAAAFLRRPLAAPSVAWSGTTPPAGSLWQFCMLVIIRIQAVQEFGCKVLHNVNTVHKQFRKLDTMYFTT
eukprot:1306350-Pleurochrysis_carterae.AAC.1